MVQLIQQNRQMADRQFRELENEGTKENQGKPCSKPEKCRDRKPNACLESDPNKEMEEHPAAQQEEEENSYTKKLEEANRNIQNWQRITEELPTSVTRGLLQSLVRQVEAMEAVLYTSRTWNKLMGQYGAAKALLLKDGASVKALKKALRNLRGAVNGLEPFYMEPQNKETDKKEKREAYPLVLSAEVDTGRSGQTSNNTIAGIHIAAAASTADAAGMALLDTIT